MSGYTAYGHLKSFYKNSENWSRTQTKWFDFFYNLNMPVVGNPWKASADLYYGGRKADEYRNRYGIKGGGHDPRILASMSGSASGMFGGVNFVSKNLERLYK